MHAIAIQLRMLQLYSHEAHHEITGEAFFADHEFLGEAYLAYEDAYDKVVERMIGLGVPVNHKELAQKAVDAFPSGQDWFVVLLDEERNLRMLILDEFKDANIGTQNLLSQIADDSEVRTFKMGQRTK